MRIRGHRKPLLWLRSLFRGDGYDYHGARVRLPNHLQSAVRWTVLKGGYEESERRLVERFLNPALPVVELGGSLGVLSSYVAKRLGDDVLFIVLEANPDIVDLCRLNATADGTRRNVRVRNAALAYDAETVSFHASRNVHESSLASHDKPGNVTVPATTLYALLRDEGIDGPYTLVCDIEGTEWDLHLRDGEALSRCAMAVIELHPNVFEREGWQVQAFLDRMAGYGLGLIAREVNVYAFGRA